MNTNTVVLGRSSDGYVIREHRKAPDPSYDPKVGCVASILRTLGERVDRIERVLGGSSGVDLFDVASFFADLDGRRWESLFAKIADDVMFRIGNLPRVVGKDSLRAMFTREPAPFRSTHHVLAGTWTGRWPHGQVVSVEAEVRYVRHDETTLSLPCTSTLRLRDGLVASYDVFMDPGPAFGAG